MSGQSISKRNALKMRHDMILGLCKNLGPTFTCADLVKITGFHSVNVRASMSYLCKSGAMSIVHHYCDEGGHKAVYGLTGNPSVHEAVRQLPTLEDAKQEEPEGRVIETIKGGVRKVKIGKDWKPGSGQNMSGISRGFSPLALVG